MGKNFYVTRDRETGTFIDEFENRWEADKAIKSYEEKDKCDGCYTPDCYEVHVVAKYKEHVFVVREVGDTEDSIELVTWDQEQAERRAAKQYAHLTPAERKKTQIVISAYGVWVNPERHPAQPAEEVYNRLIDESPNAWAPDPSAEWTYEEYEEV